MSMPTNASFGAFNSARNTEIHNSNVNFVNNPAGGTVHINNSRSALQYLHDAVVRFAGQTTNRPDAAAPCLPGTRRTALAKIDEWKRKELAPNTKPEMVWLTGPAGCGKTSVAESTCQIFREEGLLVADCFFSSSIGRTSPQYLCLTLAYQLAISSTVLRSHIEAVLDDPSVVDAPVEVQFKRLVLEPITQAGHQIPTIFIIIDGLDECGVATNRELVQIDIIRLLQRATSEHSLPIRIFISSRPEIWITNALISINAPSISKISLDQNDESNSDIRSFYIHEFKTMYEHPEIRDALPPAHGTWPSDDDINVLTNNACGQFVYAKTITRFLSDPGHADSPPKRLASLLQQTQLSASNPLEHLDALYKLILSFSSDPRTMDILGGVNMMFPESRSAVGAREVLSMLEILWDLETGSSYRLLRPCHSVFFVSRDLTPERETMSAIAYSQVLEDMHQIPRFYHKSFTDFLHNPLRSGNLCVNKEEVQRKLALGCLRVLQNTASRPETRIRAVTWSYAMCNWHIHCTRSGNMRNKPILEVLDSLRISSHHFCDLNTDGTTESWALVQRLCVMQYGGSDVTGMYEEFMKHTGNVWTSVRHSRTRGHPVAEMWAWAESQTDSGALAFLTMRFKLWYLHLLDELFRPKDGFFGA